jgi:hypothetical protein
MKNKFKVFTSVLALVSLFMAAACATKPVDAVTYRSGRVVDYFTNKPIGGAIVTMNNQIVTTDEKGIFVFKTTGTKIAVRAYGYLRTEQVIATPLVAQRLEIKLVPFTPKALYLTVYGIGSKKLRDAALKLIEETELNALVIDVKGDRGFIPFKSSVPLASEIGAQQITTVKDMKGLIESLRGKGIYTIARIVVFKDNPLALAKPELAIHKGDRIWQDRETLAWVDPFKTEVWDYNIDIAVEAARYGFDEIQFDYVRFPDTSGLKFSQESTEESRVKAICGFLTEAKRRLAPYNVFLNADIFGYVSWNQNDTKIGQRIEDLAATLEYMSLMLYPSGFQYGIPRYRNPVAHPYEIVFLTLNRARERVNLPSVRFRPWLQSFRDYAFDRKRFTGREIRDQIDAAEEFGSDGWMLWNPHNIYSEDGLKKREHADAEAKAKN